MSDSSVRISFVTPRMKRKKLDQIAGTLGTNLDSVMNDAVDNYIELHDWQLAHIAKGVQQAKKRDFALEKEIKNVFEKYGIGE